MAYLIDRINEQLAKTGLESRTRNSREWLKAQVKSLRPDRRLMMKDRENLRSKTMIGRMYFFFYDPKTKETLPYYDRFPLVLPIQRYPDGFLGLNLHYIHPKYRIILLDKLSRSFLNNDKWDETTRFRWNYPILSRAAKAFEKTPCIKRYLFTHIESRFLEITADKWDIAALLPVEYFRSENRPVTKNKVFTDSRKMF
jgi:hypothetical protein